MINIDIARMREIDALPRKQRVLEAALYYISMGQKVIPQIGKAPQVKEADASSDPMTIRRWFGPGGAFEGQNLGLVLEGVRALDLDRHDGKDGVKFIGVALDQIACPREATPGNGYHLLIQHTDLRGKPDQGVDIKTRITTWPSEVDGKAYKWETGGEPGRLNGQLVLRLGGKNVKGGGTPNTFDSKFDPLVPASYINHYLEHIDPDVEHDTWVQVGMAIHSNDTGPDSLAIWEDWSKGGSKFEKTSKGECAKKWATFNAEREKAVKIGFLVRMAKKNGAPPHEHDHIYYRSPSAILQEMNDLYGVYDAGGRICIVGVNNGKFNFYDQRGLELLYANRPIIVGDKPVNPIKIWVISEDRRSIKKLGMWMPNKEPEDSLNAWSGMAIKPIECKESDIKDFLDFCVEDICRGNKKYAEYLWDLMATKIQHPLKLMGVSLVISGGEGTGKGLLTGVLSQIIGPSHSKLVTQRSSWVGDFAGDMIANVVYLEAHEAAWSGHHSEASRLKALMTEKSMDWNGKFKSQWSSPNNMFISITTNDDWAVPAGIDSRRFFVLKSSGKYQKDRKHWRHIARLIGIDLETGEPMNPEYIGKIHHWLANRKIKHDMTRAMETEWLIKQRKETAIDSRDDLLLLWVRAVFGKETAFGFSRHGGNAILKVQIKDKEGQFIRAFDAIEDYREYTGKKGYRKAFDSTMLKSKLESIGFVTGMQRKHHIIEQGKALSDTPTDTKLSIMFVPPPDVIEQNIAKVFPLFGERNDDDDSDS